MAIFDFFFGKTKKRDDPFFGEMVFSEFKKKPENNYFNCRRRFKPTNEIIEIGIGGNFTESFELRKGFFSKIESDYEKVISSVKPMIENEFQNWKEDFKIINFKKEFNPIYLYLPHNDPETWEIAFETEHDLNHTFTITMSSFEATEILIDG